MRFVRAETRANHTRDLGRIVLGRNSVEPITSRISNEVSVSKQDGFGVLKPRKSNKSCYYFVEWIVMMDHWSPWMMKVRDNLSFVLMLIMCSTQKRTELK